VHIDELAFASATGLVTRRDGFIPPLARRAMALIEQVFAPAVPWAHVAASARSRASFS
jgi:hypothetical protein